MSFLVRGRLLWPDSEYSTGYSAAMQVGGAVWVCEKAHIRSASVLGLYRVQSLG